MSLLKELGMAYQHLSQYNCAQAIEILSVLPTQHYNTGWVLSMLARAHFEMIDYKKSAGQVILYYYVLEKYQVIYIYILNNSKFNSILNSQLFC